MILDPSQYECPEHHADLTGLVEAALEVQGPPVAYRRPPSARPFMMIVTCPGGGSTAAHPLTCTGIQTP